MIGTTTVIAEFTGHDRASAVAIETDLGLPIDETGIEMGTETDQGTEVRDTMMKETRGIDEEMIETMGRRDQSGMIVAMMIGTDEVCAFDCFKGSRLTVCPGKSRRSASPRSRSPSSNETTLPTRTRPEAKRPAPHMSFNVGSRASRSPPPQPSRPEREEETARSEDGQASEPEDEPMEEEDDDFAAMQAMMGFGGFGTTKNKKVSGNNAGGVRKEKKTEYRQYMNRNGGFNRPLSPSR